MLQYLSACLEEGMRMFPAVAEGIRRVTPSTGATISGHFIPPNASLVLPDHFPTILPNNPHRSKLASPTTQPTTTPPTSTPPPPSPPNAGSPLPTPSTTPSSPPTRRKSCSPFQWVREIV